MNNVLITRYKGSIPTEDKNSNSEGGWRRSWGGSAGNAEGPGYYNTHSPNQPSLILPTPSLILTISLHQADPILPPSLPQPAMLQPIASNGRYKKKINVIEVFFTQILYFYNVC
jgi:hypothetical protein